MNKENKLENTSKTNKQANSIGVSDFKTSKNIDLGLQMHEIPYYQLMIVITTFTTLARECFFASSICKYASGNIGCIFVSAN